MRPRTKKLAVLGGDQRQKWLALALMDEGILVQTHLVPDCSDTPLARALTEGWSGFTGAGVFAGGTSDGAAWRPCHHGGNSCGAAAGHADFRREAA